MDSELLKTFLEVSSTRHFGRAAENLCLTQTAVSFRVRQLESLPGLELFVRHRNNIRLTQAGALHPLAESSVRFEHRFRYEVAHAPRMACSMYASYHHNNSKRHLIDPVVSLARQS